MPKNAFSYRSLAGLRADIQKRKLDIPLTEEVSCLKESLVIEGKKIPNRLCANPMEGCDADEDGKPGELTYRRYKRFAAGGAGTIWVEATTVAPEGRTNPHQLWINDRSEKEIKDLVHKIREQAINHRGQKQNPFTVLQLTHSGRQSKSADNPHPIIAHHSKILDPKDNLSPDHPLITDDELDRLQEKFIHAAQMAYECGFDAVDIKACHGYIVHELLFSHTRKGSRYGGSFENRTRFLREVVQKIKESIPQLIVTTRLNVYDGIPYPWGWGTGKDGEPEPDLTEPIRLIKDLRTLGISIISIAAGNPYYNPYLERPYDRPIAGGSLPEEHPLVSIARLIRITSELKSKVPEVHLVGTGLSWLRQFFPNVGAALIREGWADLLGMGRLALANPYFANELLRDGELSPEKMCIACSSCVQMMRDGVPAGCLIRDSEVYRPIYKAGREANRKNE